MERGKIEKKCSVIKDITKIDFELKRGLLNTVKVCFSENLPRKDREKINTEMKECKLKTIWGNLNGCVMIR